MSVFRYCRTSNLIRTTSRYESSQYGCSALMKLQPSVTFVPCKTLFANNTSWMFSRGVLGNSCKSLQSGMFLRSLCVDSGKETEKGQGRNQQVSGPKKTGGREQLKMAVRDYGATVIVFHVGISLISLGICYILISNGLDATLVLKAVGFSESIISSNVAVGGSTFVIAYAVHKLFAPLRMGITVSAAPFIVRYLRRVGILKLPKS